MIEDYFINEVQLQVRSGNPDRYGQRTLAAPVTVKCRFRFKQSLVRTELGEQLLSDAQVRVSPSVVVAVGDVVVYQGQSWQVMSVGKSQGWSPLYQVLYLGGGT